MRSSAAPSRSSSSASSTCRVPQLVVADARDGARPRRRRVLRRADARARGRRRHRDEREDDDRVPALRDPRRGRPQPGPPRHDREPRRRRAAGGHAHDAGVGRPPADASARCSTRATARSRWRRPRTAPSSGGSSACASRALAFTNLSPEHLDLHGTLEAYFDAKRRLFVEPDVDGNRPPAAVNVGDPYGRRLAEELRRARRRAAHVRDRRRGRRAPCRPSSSSGVGGSRFRLGGLALETRLRGRFNVENVLAAVALARLLGRRGRGDRARRRAPRRACPDGSRRWTKGSRSPCSSTTRTRPTRSRTSSARRAPSRPAACVCVFGCGGDRDRAEAPADGRRRDRPRGHGDRHLRQPAQRGSGGDHRRGRSPGRTGAPRSSPTAPRRSSARSSARARATSS